MKHLFTLIFLSFFNFLSFAQVINITLVPVGKSSKIDSIWVLDVSVKSIYSLKSKYGFAVKNDKSLVHSYYARRATDKRFISIGADTINVKAKRDNFLYVKVFSGKMKTIVPFYTDKDTTLEVYFDECVDVDGNSYTIMKADDMLWMVDNLKTAHFTDGGKIPYVKSKEDWQKDTLAAYTKIYFSNRFTKDYGYLYNWYAVSRGIAPKGWKVPTVEDWTRFENLDLGSRGNGKNVASKLKEMALVPAGYIDVNGEFMAAGNAGYWWLADKTDNDKAWYFFLNYLDVSVGLNNADKRHGFSVRCVKYLDKK